MKLLTTLFVELVALAHLITQIRYRLAIEASGVDKMVQLRQSCSWYQLAGPIQQV
ncbi:hypothetical protein D3C73_1460770 [compost metagenome]